MTVSEEHLKSLRDSTERVFRSVVVLGSKVLSDPRIAGPAERVQRELRQARAVGQFTVLAASHKLKQSVHPVHENVVSANQQPASATVASPPSCIPEYVNLSASQIVPLVRALNDGERAEVLEYENATRQRKTILAALRKSTT